MENFEDIKVGDQVILNHRFNEAQLVKVAKVNKTTFVIDFGNYTQKFRLSDGMEYGGNTWSHWYAIRPTPERLQKYYEEKQRSKFLYACRNCRFDSLSTEKLKEIYEIIKK